MVLLSHALGHRSTGVDDSNISIRTLISTDALWWRERCGNAGESRCFGSIVVIVMEDGRLGFVLVFGEKPELNH